MTAERLSALDASFLAVEGPATPMHVGWVALLDPPEEGPRPGHAELSAHLQRRLAGARRYRQRLAPVPLGLHEPVWVDDVEHELADHLPHAPGTDLDAIADGILSTPLARDRPLWEIHIADGLPDGRIALVGKMHHCMVDGAAVAELGARLLDREPGGWRDPPAPSGGAPAAPEPSRRARLTRAVAERAGDGVALVRAPVRLATSPERLRRFPAAAGRGARTLGHTLLPPAPASPLNRPGSARRRHVRTTRPLDDIRALRRRFGVTPNDVMLAACAGGLRRYALARGEAPQRLKAMVPADVRTSEDDAASGNRIAFLFIGLPCDEPDPVARLMAINAATAQRRDAGEADDVDVAFRALARAPRSLQRALAHGFGHPRLSNLTVSSVPGPAVARYFRGCRLAAVHSAIPLSGRHALSIGIVTVAGQACFGVYADPQTLPDADVLAGALHEAVDELLEAA